MKDYTKLIESISGVKYSARIAEGRYLINIKPLPQDVEAMIELTLVNFDNKDPQSIPNLRFKHKYTDKVFKNLVRISACITTRGTKKYSISPLCKIGHEINFEVLREISDENIIEMIQMTIDMYKNQGGEN